MLVGQGQKVTLEDFTTQNTFSTSHVSGLHSMNDGEHYTTLEAGGTKIVKYAYKSGQQVEVVFDIEKIKKNPADVKNISGYWFSPDESKLLVFKDVEPIYRHSFRASYYVYDIRYRELIPVTEEGKQQVPAFSPDGMMLAFVKENDLYIKKLRFGTTSAVTDDGEVDKVLNGIPDWVYEEEFGYNQAYEWSPNSEDLAFVRFDESEVKEYSFPLYRASHPAEEAFALYPGSYSYKYPKAGEANSKVSVQVFNVRNRTTKTMDIGDLSDSYIPRLRWSKDPTKLGVIQLNRLQNQLDLYLANPASGVCRVVLTVRNEKYIPEKVLDQLQFLEDGKHFVFVGEMDGYNHIHLYTMAGQKVRQVTRGSWDVTDYLGFDAKKKLFYFQAAAVSPLQREVYSIDMKGEKQQRLTAGEGTNSVTFSDQFQYFINTYSSVNTPPVVSVFQQNGKLLRVLEENSALKNLVKGYDLPGKTFFSFVTSNGDSLNGYMIKPLGFDESKTYPVLMTQYSGPGSQQVLDRWGLNWESYLATQGVMVVCVDGRGTGARGEAFLKSTYMQLGKLESNDQIETAKYLGSLSYVDANRIAIWGWSFGGYMVPLSMSKSDVFKLGIAVAPVTNWRYYDSVYTERFLRTPQKNPKGYDENSPIYLAEHLSGRLFLIHGSADDNVHFQNTMEFADQLVQSGKQFDMFVYPNRNHGIRGGNTRHHLYTMMSRYLFDNL
jgi:dipeptidyl-peptidase-4